MREHIHKLTISVEKNIGETRTSNLPDRSNIFNEKKKKMEFFTHSADDSRLLTLIGIRRARLDILRKAIVTTYENKSFTVWSM